MTNKYVGIKNNDLEVIEMVWKWFEKKIRKKIKIEKRADRRTTAAATAAAVETREF